MATKLVLIPRILIEEREVRLDVFFLRKVCGGVLLLISSRLALVHAGGPRLRTCVHVLRPDLRTLMGLCLQRRRENAGLSRVLGVVMKVVEEGRGWGSWRRNGLTSLGAIISSRAVAR